MFSVEEGLVWGDFVFFQNQKKFPIVWFQLLGGFPANIGYQSINCMYVFGLLQLNALVAFDFLTCTLPSAPAACAYVFKETWILSTLGRRRKRSWSFFFGGELVCFFLLKWKVLRKRSVWQRFSLAWPNCLNYGSKFFKLQWGGGKGENQSF